MIKFSSVGKQYGPLTVLENLQFSIGEGEVVGLLGPNGAGKTTTLRIMTGVLPPTRGQVTVDGRDPLEDETVKHQIGFLPENNPLYDEMTVEEWLAFWSQVKNQQVSITDIKTAVTRSGLEDVYFRPINELSKGYRQRVGLAQAILGQPQILVLDEPTEGLDPNQRHDIHTLIKELGKKRTVIISSHVLSEISRMCSRVMILNKGVIVADGTPEDLRSSAEGGHMVQTILKGTKILSTLKKIKGVLEIKEETLEDSTSLFTLTCKPKVDVRLEIFESAKENKWKLYELTTKQMELEDVFTQLTK